MQFKNSPYYSSFFINSSCFLKEYIKYKNEYQSFIVDFIDKIIFSLFN